MALGGCLNCLVAAAREPSLRLCFNCQELQRRLEGRAAVGWRESSISCRRRWIIQRKNLMASPLRSLIASGTKLWLDSIDPELVAKNRAMGATGATSNPIIIADLIKTGRFDDDLDQFDAIAFYTSGMLTADGPQHDPPMTARGKQRLGGRRMGGM